MTCRSARVAVLTAAGLSLVLLVSCATELTSPSVSGSSLHVPGASSTSWQVPTTSLAIADPLPIFECGRQEPNLYEAFDRIFLSGRSLNEAPPVPSPTPVEAFEYFEERNPLLRRVDFDRTIRLGSKATASYRPAEGGDVRLRLWAVELDTGWVVWKYLICP